MKEEPGRSRENWQAPRCSLLSTCWRPYHSKVMADNDGEYKSRRYLIHVGYEAEGRVATVNKTSAHTSVAICYHYTGTQPRSINLQTNCTKSASVGQVNSEGCREPGTKDYSSLHGTLSDTNIHKFYICSK